MALPTDLSTLNYVFQGAPHCWIPSKTDTDLFSMDYVFQGSVFVGNQELVAPLDANNGSMDQAWAGMPFVVMGADSTLDLAWAGMPFVGGTEGLDRVLVTTVQVLNITAPQAIIEGLQRKFPNPRTEMVYSEQEPAHSFPYVAAQNSALIP